MDKKINNLKARLAALATATAITATMSGCGSKGNSDDNSLVTTTTTTSSVTTTTTTAPVEESSIIETTTSEIDEIEKEIEKRIGTYDDFYNLCISSDEVSYDDSVIDLVYKDIQNAYLILNDKKVTFTDDFSLSVAAAAYNKYLMLTKFNDMLVDNETEEINEMKKLALLVNKKDIYTKEEIEYVLSYDFNQDYSNYDLKKLFIAQCEFTFIYEICGNSDDRNQEELDNKLGAGVLDSYCEVLDLACEEYVKKQEGKSLSLKNED